MAVHVVHLLEVVGVEHQQRASVRILDQRRSERLREVAPVEDAGQLVRPGAQLGLAVGAIQLGLQPLALGDVARDAVVEQRAVRLAARTHAVEDRALAAVEADDAVLEVDRLPLGKTRDRRPPELVIVGVHDRLPDAVVLLAAGERSAEQNLPVGPAVDGLDAPVGVDLERVQMTVHRLHDPRQRRVRLVELGAHAPPLGDVGHDAADLDRPVWKAAGRGAVVHPARDPVGADQAVLDVAPLAAGERVVEGVVRGPVLRVQGRLPVLHLGVGRGAAQQAVRAGPLEHLLDPSVGMRQRQVHVLAGDVEQAGEPLAHLGQARIGLHAPRDVGDDALDGHAAVAPATRAGAVPQHPGDAVEPEQPVGDLRVLAAQQPAVEAARSRPGRRRGRATPRATDLAGGSRPAEEALERRPVRVMDVLAVERHLARVHELLEQVEDAREVGVRAAAAEQGVHPPPRGAADGRSRQSGELSGHGASAVDIRRVP